MSFATSPIRKWGALLVLSLALAIIVIDTTLLNVSLSAIIKDLNTDLNGIQWVITAYSLTLAALTITGGRLGDIFGRKRMFMLGAVIFALGSFVTSLSHTLATMIIGEAIIEGIGAALMMPATSSLLVASFKGRERAIAFGIWGAVAAGAAALGPILGGYLTTTYSWRWGFRINVVVAAVLLIGSILISESQDTEEKPALDWVGVVLSATGLLSFVFGVIESATYGWWMAKKAFEIGGHHIDLIGGLSITPIAMVVGALLLGVFAFWESYIDAQGKTPLVSPRLFANQQFTSGVLTMAVLSLGQAGLIFSLPVFLQSVRGLDAYHTGLALLPMPVALLIVAPLAAGLSSKITPKYLIQAGLIISALSYYVLYATLKIDTTVANLIPGLALFGVGMGLVMSQISNLTLSAVSVQEAGEASGVNNTVRQIGSTLGSAIIGAVLLSALSSNLVSGINNSTVIPEVAKASISQNMAAQASSSEFSQSQDSGQTVSPTIATELEHIAKQASTDANRSTFLYSVAFTLLGFLVSFGLPNVKNLEKSQSAASGH